MGFYEEIKDLYKKNIDTKTGLMLEEKIQLEGVISLMKDMAKAEMLIGKNHTERRFTQNSKTVHNIPGDGYGIVFTNDDIYRLFGKAGRLSMLREEFHKEFGPEFEIAINIIRLIHSSSYLHIDIKWPLPKEGEV